MRHKRRPSKQARRANYQAYLSSPGWKRKAGVIRKRAGGKCRKCGKPGNHVHHETYERRGNERLSDLTYVCKPCHKKLHN